jgi:hypothetical protein
MIISQKHIRIPVADTLGQKPRDKKKKRKVKEKNPLVFD